MSWTQKFYTFAGLSLLLAAFAATAQEETIVVLPDQAADQARDVTANIVLPDEAAEGQATAEANRAEAAENRADAAANALEALAEAQANAADAASQGLQTAIDAVEGARGDLGRGNRPDGLPDQVPTDVPPGPPAGVVPDNVDLPSPPVGN